MMKKSLAWGSVIALCLLLMLSSCTFYQEPTYATEDGITYCVADMAKVCFADGILVSADDFEADVYIPDCISTGHKVEGIGGYVGMGVPVPCVLGIEGLELEPFVYDDAHPDEVEVYTITLHLGKNIRQVEFYDMPTRDGEASSQCYKVVGAERYVRIDLRFEVDEENPLYYAKDGILCTRKETTVTALSMVRPLSP